MIQKYFILFIFFPASLWGQSLSYTFNQVKISSLPSIILAEDPDLPIANITSACINSSGTYLLATDAQSGNAFVFSTLDGKLLRKFEPDSTFTDTLASKGKWPNKEAIYIPTSKSPVYSPFIKNSVINSLFLNDSEIISVGTLSANLKKVDSDLILGVAGQTSIFKYNVNNAAITINPLEWKFGSYAPQSNCFVIESKEKKIIVNVNIQNNGALSRGHLDSSICLGVFDLNGKFLNFMPITLPVECNEYYLKASQMTPKLFSTPHDELVLGYEILPRIYTVGNSREFNIANLGVTNDSFFIDYKNFILTHPSGSQIPWDSLYIKKPYWFSNVSVDSENNYYITSAIRTSLRPWRIKFVVQEYGFSGKNIASQTFQSDEHLDYKYVFYSKEIRKVVSIALQDKKNWLVSFKPFE